MRQRLLTAAAAVIFLVGVVLSLIVLFSPPNNRVNILRDGRVLYTLDLSEEKNRCFVVEYGSSSNTIEIRDGKIRVLEAECPDKTCVRSGWLTSSAMPIVCLPNHLVIEFASGQGEIDAIAE